MVDNGHNGHNSHNSEGHDHNDHHVISPDFTIYSIIMVHL